MKNKVRLFVWHYNFKSDSLLPYKLQSFYKTSVFEHVYTSVCTRKSVHVCTSVCQHVCTSVCQHAHVLFLIVYL